MSNNAEALQQLKDRLAESEQRFEGAFDTAAHGMALVSPEGRWLRVNTAVCDLLGYTNEELLKTDFQAITHPDDLESDLGYVQQLLADEIPNYHMEKRYFHKSGRVIWVMLSVSLVRDKHHEPLYFVSQIIDITETKRAMQQARKATQVAEQANRAKSQFLAQVSHELRTPLNSILGFSRRIKRNASDRLDPRELDAIDTIFSNGNKLLYLINDILDLSKIESGNVELELTTFVADDVIRSVIERTEALASNKGLKIETRLAEQPIQITSDYGRLEQILLNLMSNAIKYTQQGSITLGLYLAAEGSDSHHVVFDVTDTGMGIEPEDIPGLFTEFSRSKKVRAMDIPGTGLGLAICRQFADLLKGTIDVTSQPGKGSTFRVTLPVSDQDSALNPPISYHQATDASANVICLGDNEALMQDLYRELTPLGIYPALVTTLSGVMSASDNTIPDLIFLDYSDDEQKYKKDLQRLRSVESLINTHICVCCDSRAIFERLEDLGANSYLPRPFGSEELTAILRHAKLQQTQ